ncbi:sensor histidine kinase [Rufibacter quisquiliarum]|uniref:histidine kinase n=1 Tax=Rufibacter quisquiliarum TaxID=1549639 RepID=A0A839GNF0_9BACT|nr:ATP-binding protein [Rufibacter quisquiliarum]MBA9079463.1 signal transduction histidine kinase [Rufibacter quisquiliarum]
MKEHAHTCQEQLKQLQTEFDEFAYIVSHDLKAPLRAISNLSGWIKEDLGEALEPDIAHNIHLLQNRTERMERMISALLSFSRVGRQDLEVREVAVQEMIEKIAAPFQEKSGLKVHLSQLPTLTTYCRKLETVFCHLLQNAVQFNEQETPEVWISAKQLPTHFLFSVRDNGIGIPADSLGKIFKMFYTVQPKDRQESLGAGLTIVHKIVRFAGGTIEAKSDLNQGTEMLFTWPLSLTA